MQNSSSFCRSQEAIQTKRAEDSPLQNVKSIAMQAAAMWRNEAVAAEQREQRHGKRVAALDAEQQPDQGADEG